MTPGAVVLVDFPFSSKQAQPYKRRPVLVLGVVGTVPDQAVFVVMITSNARRVSSPKNGDIVVQDHLAAGLPLPSVVRTRRVWTAEATDVAKVLGQVDAALLEDVRQAVRALIT